MFTRCNLFRAHSLGGGGGGGGGARGGGEEAMKPGHQHKFGNLTLFSPQTCSDDIHYENRPIQIY